MEGTTMNKEARTVDESRVETIHIVRPNHLNGANRLFGGILMQWIDEVAGIVAKRHSMCNVTTASVDNLTFLHGAYQNEMVVIKGKITWVGSSSMEVCVDTYVETLSGEQRRINNAHFMMVALDENDKPARVPRLILQTEDEKLAWAHGEERRRIRAQRKEAKLDGI
jgi:acyl-CoA hydrolase